LRDHWKVDSLITAVYCWMVVKRLVTMEVGSEAWRLSRAAGAEKTPTTRNAKKNRARVVAFMLQEVMVDLGSDWRVLWGSFSTGEGLC
jgi:hypothetical protein